MSTVDEIMTPRPYCIKSDALISDVTEIMIQKRINCLPVKNGEELVGIITNYDLVKYLNNIINTI
jgi:CBS domain-containing protein